MARLVSFVALIVLLAGCGGPAVAQRLPVQPLTIESASGARHVFRVELALTASEQARGLMHRRHLADDAGMLFVFPETQPISFWMKNTLIPLDMLFVDRRGRIYHIHENATPLSERAIKAPRPGKAVLEIAGGLARRLGIKPGDRIRHPVFR